MPLGNVVRAGKCPGRAKAERMQTWLCVAIRKSEVVCFQGVGRNSNFGMLRIEIAEGGGGKPGRGEERAEGRWRRAGTVVHAKPMIS